MIRRGLALFPAAALLALAHPLAAGVGPVGQAFVPITACRTVDTRGPAGPNGGPALGANALRIFPVAGTCGVPANALGLVVNLTVVDPAAPGYAQLFAGDAPVPPTTVLSFKARNTRAGVAFVALASDGSGTIALANGSAGSADYILDVEGYFIPACTSTITVTNPATSGGDVNAAFSQTFTSSGGVGAMTFSTASALPPGLALAANGTLSGTPTQPGTFPITVTATDQNGCTGTGQTYTLVIACQTISVTNPAVAAGTANAPFSQTFTQAGGVGTTTFSTASALPIGMTLAASGVLSGTPTQAGGFDVVVTATDVNGCTGAGTTYHLVINCQTIAVANPATASGTANAPFSQTFTQTGAIGSATFTTASTLPAGLSLGTNGVLSGTPTQTGTFPIVVTVTDGNLCTGTSATYNLVIGCQTISVTNPGVATGTANTPFSQTFTQVGGIGSVTFATASTLPTGLTLGANGILSGTPTQTGTFPITVTATDANGCTGISAVYTLVVGCQTFNVNPASLPQGTTGVAYPAVVFSHAGGIGAVTFALTGALPSGMNFTPGTATLDGLPTQSGSFPVTVTATDANGCTASRDYLLVVVCSGSSITLAPGSLPTVTVNAAFTPVIFTASGGTGPYTFAEAGTLPNGMNFNPGTATLDGTPTETGSFAITISATDTVGLCVGSRDYVINVTCSGVTITVAPPSLPAAPAGAPYGPVTFTASGGTGLHTFALTGALPTGMTFTGDVLSGTPTESGTFPLTVTATDANGCVGSTTYSLVITCPVITVTNPATTSGTVNAAFSQTFTQSGGALPATFSLASGSLPAGVTLDANTGVLSGTPTVSGTFPVTIKATDSNGCAGTGTPYTLVIACQTITVTNPVVNVGADGAPFSQTFTQTGAIGGATFSLASGSLPAGWTLTSAGVLANATPTSVQFTISVLVTDGNGCTGTGATYTVGIVPVAAGDTYAPTIVGNMSIDTATGTTFSVLTNDSAGTTAAIFTPAVHGTVVVNPDGTFTYAPDRGYEGADSFQYKATHTASGLASAAATVSLTVTGVVWFVDNNPGSCSAGCDGRRATPYATLAAFQAVNDGVGANPKPNHRVFLAESNPANPYVGPVTLLNGQRLIGQDFTGTFAAATGLAVPDTTVAVPVMDAGNGFVSEVTNGVAANAINLVTDSSVIGLRATASSGVAISQAVAPPAVGAAPLGTTTLTEVEILSTTTALSVVSTTGSFSYVSGSITASGSNVVGAIYIQGGTSAITIAVPITSAGAGQISISQRGAGATTTFNGPVLMTGSAMGISIGGLLGAGTVAFNAPVQLGTGPGSRMTGAGSGSALFVNHSGTASTTTFANLSIFATLLTGIDAQKGGTLAVSGPSVDVTGAGALRLDGAPGTTALNLTLGTIAQASGSGAGAGISLNNVSGSIVAGAASLANTGAQGISITNSTATVNFGATSVSNPSTQGILVSGSTSNASFGNTIINGGTDAVSLQNNSAGTRSFGTLGITTPSLVGFLHAVGGGNTTVTGAATITNPGGLGVSVDGMSAGQAINFNSTLSVTKGAAGTAVALGATASNSLAATLNLGTLSVSTSSGTAILAGSGGTSTPLTTSGSGLITATNGPAINATSTTFNAIFGSVSSTNSTTQGITLTGALGTLTMNGGSITGATGIPFTTVGGTVTATYGGGITQAGANPMVSVTGGHATGTLTFQTGTLSATNGTGLQFDNADGTYAFNGTTTLNGGDAGIDIINGSSGTFTFGASASISNPTGIAYREDSSTATVNYNGTITKTNNAAHAVDINAKTGGSTTFSGAITASTTTANAIDLTNTGGTVTFRGGLAVTTTSGVGFNASGTGATVAVCDENPCVPGATGGLVNTLTSTTGTALNVTNTTIGANHLEFRSISSNGATNGIVLNTTGATGGLKVKGNGGVCSSAGTCTGGSIQNAAVGVSLTSTTGVSIDRLFIQNTTSHGVGGTLVSGLSFTNGLVNNSGTALGAEAANIAFNTTAAGTENNLSGVVTITGNTLTNAYYHGVDIFNFNGTISDANISSNTITSSTSTATSKGLGVRFVAFGSASTVANVTKATIASNIISNFPSGTGILASGGNGNAAGPAGVFGTAGSGVNIIAITGNRVAGFSAANRFGAFAIATTVNGKGQGSFDISSNGTLANPVGNSIGTAISLGSFGSANVTANVANNVIVANNSVGAQGIGAGTSSTWGATDTPGLTVTISNNTISQTDGNGILVTARDATGTVRAKIQNNTVAAPLGGVRPGIRVDAGNGVSIDDSICLNISGNTSAGSGGSQGLGLRKQGTVTTTNDFGANGMGATSTPGVEAFVDGLNPAGGGTLLISATSGFSNCSFP